MDSQEARAEIGDRLQFDGKRTSWRVRAVACEGRYALATTKIGRNVLYTLIDFEQSIRGAMNVVGQGLGIFTTDGHDTAVDDAVWMLEQQDYEVSSRNRVALNITQVWLASSSNDKRSWYMEIGRAEPRGVVQTTKGFQPYTLPEHILRLAQAEYEHHFGHGQDYEWMQERSGLGITEVIGLLADYVDRLGGKPTEPRTPGADRG